MAVYIKALGMSRRGNRVIPYRVTIGGFSTVFYGTVRDLNEYVASVRYVLESMQ